MTTPQETTEAPESAAVREAAQRARAAAPAVRAAGEGRIDDALRAAASLIRDRAHELLDVNAADVAAAELNGMAAGLLDRLRLDPERLAGIATSSALQGVLLLAWLMSWTRMIV